MAWVGGPAKRGLSKQQAGRGGATTNQTDPAGGFSMVGRLGGLVTQEKFIKISLGRAGTMQPRRLRDLSGKMDVTKERPEGPRLRQISDGREKAGKTMLELLKVRVRSESWASHRAPPIPLQQPQLPLVTDEAENGASQVSLRRLATQLQRASSASPRVHGRRREVHCHHHPPWRRLAQQCARHRHHRHARKHLPGHQL